MVFASFLRGAEPKQLALSTAVGLTLGVFPICGEKTMTLCSVHFKFLHEVLSDLGLFLKSYVVRLGPSLCMLVLVNIGALC